MYKHNIEMLEFDSDLENLKTEYLRIYNFLNFCGYIEEYKNKSVLRKDKIQNNFIKINETYDFSRFDGLIDKVLE